MARKKGSGQKRNETKYWLPDGITLIDSVLKYTKDTKLRFNDPTYGEFISSFKAIQDAGLSTHPVAVSTRRKATNITRYGSENVSSNKEIRARAKKTMVTRYGVENALQNKELLAKSQKTLESNYGVKTPMESKVIKERLKESFIESYGVDNPMKAEAVQEKLKAIFREKYGVDNPAQSPQVKEAYLKTLAEKEVYQSKEEIELKEFVESLGIECGPGYFGGTTPKQIDIKIPSLKIGIEYNGSYWHSECNKNIHKNYHLNKLKVATDSGYKLIQIMDVEWKTRNKQVKSFLKSALGKNEIRVGARETEVMPVFKDEANKFLEEYHILGKVPFIYALGLYYNKELVAMITIGKHHRGNDELVLNRYVGKENVTVSGGLSKLTKEAVAKMGPITTWVDRRISNGENWIKCGWSVISTLPPDYCYFEKRTGKIISKQSRKKSKVKTPDGMTEYEHAIQDGLYRIYDCGKIKLIAK